MINLFEISINMLEEFIIQLFLTLYFGCKYSGMKKIVGFIGWLIIGVTVITLLNCMYIYEGVLGLIFIGTYFVYELIFLKGDVYSKLFMSGCINSIVYSIALFSSLCVSFLFSGNNYELYDMTMDRVAAVIISQSLLFIVCSILLKFRFCYTVKKKDIIPLIMMPVITELSTVGIMQVFLTNINFTSELMLASVGVMLANFLTYYIFIKINKDTERETELVTLQQRIDNDKKNARDIEELYSKVCGTHHDLLLHFSTVSRLLDEDPDKARAYIKDVTHNQLDTIKTLIKTGNDCFDAIANAKIALCEKHRIVTRIYVKKNSLNGLSRDEIVTLFGNLLDNAIEASKDSTRKIIRLDVRADDGFLSILLKNTIDKSVLDANSELRTTKKEKAYHGFGVKNIKRIINKYNGFIDYYEEDGYFVCDIMLPVKKDRAA